MQNEITKKQIPPSRKGIKHSEKTKAKMRDTHKKNGSGKWMKGKKHSKATLEKMRSTHKRLKTKPPVLKGSESPNWKGGLTSLVNRIRKCFKYRQWRSDVFTRDDFTCQECSIDGVYLEAHHIKKFADIMKKYNIKTFEEALNCEELWNINNGVTLCKKCHCKTENYGNKK